MSKLITGVSTDKEFLNAINEKGSELTESSTPEDLLNALDSTGGNVSYNSTNEHIIHQINEDTPSEYIPWEPEVYTKRVILIPNVTVDVSEHDVERAISDIITMGPAGLHCDVNFEDDFYSNGEISFYFNAGDNTVEVLIGGSTFDPSIICTYKVSSDFSTYTMKENGYYTEYDESTGEYSVAKSISTTENTVVTFGTPFKYSDPSSTECVNTLVSKLFNIEKTK